MSNLTRKQYLRLIVGDLLIFLVSLWLTLLVRYFEIPSKELFFKHLESFSLLFLVWIFVFFTAGLYEKQTLLLKKKLPKIIFNAQLVNIVIAVIFFFVITRSDITPKTNLFLYLLISSALVIIWRYRNSTSTKSTSKIPVLMLANDTLQKRILEEVEHNNIYLFTPIALTAVDIKKSPEKIYNLILSAIEKNNVKILFIDYEYEYLRPILPGIYELMASGIRVVDIYEVYEELFEKIPVDVISYTWPIRNLDSWSNRIYSFIKRMIDIIFASILGIITITLSIFIWLANKLDSGVGLYYKQKRIGINGQIIEIVKFQTMSNSDSGNMAKHSKASITKVGYLLRRLHIDEFPQYWNILRGELSFVGPRPEIPEIATVYEKEIPYYRMRYLTKPGLSGWAQIHQDKNNVPKFGTNVTSTEEKLSYDLFYIKNRSVWLDIKIFIQTVRVFFARSGR